MRLARITTVAVVMYITYCEGVKFRWIGHTLRKEDGEISKAALLWNPQGSRKT